MATPYYSNTDIIAWAKGSQALALVGEAKKLSLKGLSPSEDLDIKLYCARKSLEWQVDQNANDSLVYELADYVYALCFPYVLEAMQVISGGGSAVDPVSPTDLTGSALPFIEVRKSDFANGTDYLDDRLRGKILSVDGNWIGEKIISEGVDWETIDGGGVRILTDGFNSQSSDFNNTEVIIRILIKGTIPEASTPSTTAYDLSADTEITALASGTPYQVRTIVIKPNGYNYTWATTFVFTDNWPEQPLANAVNTKQIYTFMYIAGVGDVCVSQSLNIAV